MLEMINFISLKIIKRKIENRRKFEMENLVYLAPIAGVIALIFAAYKALEKLNLEMKEW